MSGRSDIDIPDTSSSNIHLSRGLPSPREVERDENIIREIRDNGNAELKNEIFDSIQEETKSQESSTTSNKKSPKESVVISTNPPLSSKHFPFGHGLGYEELLLLGLILLLSGNEDGGVQELNISQLILTALLFCG